MPDRMTTLANDVSWVRHSSREDLDRLRMIEILKRPKVCVNGKMESLQSSLVKAYVKMGTGGNSRAKRLGLHNNEGRRHGLLTNDFILDRKP